MGFVEALIAIMITGIASVVLMGISANTLKSMVNTEIQDRMAQIGRSGAVIAQGVADLESEKDQEDRFFFEDGIEGFCFKFNYEEGEGYSFNSNNKLAPDTRTAYLTSLVEEEGDEQPYYFRVMCVEDILVGTTTSRPRALIKIITGYTKTTGSYTSTRDIKDYEYLAVINL